MQGTNTVIELQFPIRRAKCLGLFRARHFLAACVVWETTWLYSQLEARHQLYCLLCEVSCVSLILKEEKGAGTGLPSHYTRSQYRELQESPEPMKSETLLGPLQKE